MSGTAEQPIEGDPMTGQEARDEAVHWVGDAPTSLHGNGASSFNRTTRDPLFVTCALCRTLLAREHLGGVFLYGLDHDFIARCSCGWEEECKFGHEAEDALANHLVEMAANVATEAAGYRKHPEPEEERTERRITYRYGVNQDQRYSSFYGSFDSLQEHVEQETQGRVDVTKREQRTVTYGPWVPVGEGER